jgi:hypothetical protein
MPSVWLTWHMCVFTLQAQHQLQPWPRKCSRGIIGQLSAAESVSRAGHSATAALVQSQRALPPVCTICIAAVTVLCVISAGPSSTLLPLLQSCRAARPYEQTKGESVSPRQVTRPGHLLRHLRSMKASDVRNRCRGLWACFLMQSVQVGAVGVLQ